MTLPDDIEETLRRLGEDLGSYSSIAEKYGVEFLRLLVAEMELSAEAFNEWYPRLTAFVADKRAATSVPPDTALSPIERAWNRILEPKILGAKHLPGGVSYKAFIFAAPLCTLPMVQSHWPGSMKNAVFLTPPELQEWRSQHVDPENEFKWSLYEWWEINETIGDESRWMLEGIPSLPSEMMPWLVRWGRQWVSADIGYMAELWGWNGDQEQLIRVIGVCDPWTHEIEPPLSG